MVCGDYIPYWKWNSHSARELVYRSLDAADQAEVRRHALMSCGAWRLSRSSGGLWNKKYPWKNLDAGTPDGNYEGGRCGGSTPQIETRII